MKITSRFFPILLILVFCFFCSYAYSVEYHIATTGDDTNNGTSLETAWKTLRHAVRSGTEIAAGDTVYIHGGTYYNYPGTDYSGSIANRVYCIGGDGNPVTIKNYNGETVIIENGYPEFRTVPNSDWVLVDANKGLYRSANTYGNPGTNGVYGTLGADNSNYILIAYGDYQDINSSNQLFTLTDATGIYCGPGIHWSSSDSYFYIRTQKSDKEVAMGYNIPANSDPRQTTMTLFPYHWLLYIQGTAHDVTFEGLIFKNCSIVCEIAAGAHHINFKNCTITGNKYGIIIKDTVHHVTIDGLSRTIKFPDWVSYSDVKHNLIPCGNIKGVGIDIQYAANNIEIMNCIFDGGWAANYLGLMASAGSGHDIKIHHNVYRNFRDGVIPVGSSYYNIEVSYNKILQCFEGVSFYDSGNCDQKGTKYIHHNLIDTTTPHFGGRLDPPTEGFPSGLLSDYYDEGDGRNGGDGMIVERPFGMHADNGGDWGGGDPWKVYNNTCISGRDGNMPNNTGLGLSYRIQNFPVGIYHEVYNNIFVMVDDGNMLYMPRLDDASQVYDGNIYYRSFPNPTNPFFSLWRDVYGGASKDFTSLADFRDDVTWVGYTTDYYPAGWEANGVQTDPKLDSNYRPSVDSPARTRRVDISSKGWPDCNSNYIGAFPAYTILISIKK